VGVNLATDKPDDSLFNGPQRVAGTGNQVCGNYLSRFALVAR
jgi:hypothetical protein